MAVGGRPEPVQEPGRHQQAAAEVAEHVVEVAGDDRWRVAVDARHARVCDQPAQLFAPLSLAESEMQIERMHGARPLGVHRNAQFCVQCAACEDPAKS